MRLTLGSLCWSALPLLIAACARETLEPEQLSAATTEDAGIDADVEPPPPDGGTMTPPDGQACLDDDADGVCNAQDNCPATPNPTQDPQGCQTQPGSCPTIAASVQSDLWTLSEVSVNDRGNSVSLDDSVALRVSIKVRCPAIVSGISVFQAPTIAAELAGPGGAMSNPTCAEVSGCTLLGGTGSATLSFPAPSGSGTYRIKAVAHQDVVPGMCTTDLDGSQDIAAVCVK